MPSRSTNMLRFETFEVDLRAGELYKAGRKIKLQVQPFHVLAMLLEKPGEVVTREEMQKRLWPADTFVDFDHSVNTAVKKLRQALGDDKKKPKFVETLPKRGYRFLGNVKKPKSAADEGAVDATAGATARAVKQGKSAWVGRVAKLCCKDGKTLELLAVDEATALEREKLDEAGDDVGLSMLIAAHRLLMVADETPLRVIEVDSGNGRCQARILEGEHYGKTAVLPLKLLAKAEREPRAY